MEFITNTHQNLTALICQKMQQNKTFVQPTSPTPHPVLMPYESGSNRTADLMTASYYGEFVLIVIQPKVSQRGILWPMVSVFLTPFDSFDTIYCHDTCRLCANSNHLLVSQSTWPFLLASLYFRALIKLFFFEICIFLQAEYEDKLKLLQWKLLLLICKTYWKMKIHSSDSATVFHSLGIFFICAPSAHTYMKSLPFQEEVRASTKIDVLLTKTYWQQAYLVSNKCWQNGATPVRTDAQTDTAVNINFSSAQTNATSQANHNPCDIYYQPLNSRLLVN